MGDEHERVDAHMGTQYKPQWPSCDLTDFSKLRIADGRIRYRLYRQDGTMQDMNCADTRENRMTVSWFQIHDRYAAPTPKEPKP